jgi:hypothetical protein
LATAGYMAPPRPTRNDLGLQVRIFIECFSFLPDRPRQNGDTVLAGVSMKSRTAPLFGLVAFMGLAGGCGPGGPGDPSTTVGNIDDQAAADAGSSAQGSADQEKPCDKGGSGNHAGSGAGGEAGKLGSAGEGGKLGSAGANGEAGKLGSSS